MVSHTNSLKISLAGAILTLMLSACDSKKLESAIKSARASNGTELDQTVTIEPEKGLTLKFHPRPGMIEMTATAQGGRIVAGLARAEAYMGSYQIMPGEKIYGTAKSDPVADGASTSLSMLSDNHDSRMGVVAIVVNRENHPVNARVIVTSKPTE